MKFSMTVRSLGLVISLLFLAACSKNESFIYREKLRDNPWMSTDFKVKEIQGASGVDILWVIDNSGSMYTAQQNVISNSALFMQDFLKNQLSWKLGLLSTDIGDRPYLGMEPGDDFDFKSPDPVNQFQSAVSGLGTSGDATEKPFGSLFKGLTQFPQFLRPNMPLAIIFVTDTFDQSRITAQQFVSQLKGILGPNKEFYTYAILGADDFNCDGEGFDYAGSEYEKVLAASKIGRVFSLCATDFGQNLAIMGKEIAEQVIRSTIYLQDRPVYSSIKVVYEGTELKGGSQAEGAQWYYDYGKNAIVFYNLSFALNPTDSVSVLYKVDDGFSGETR
jgi:hypothetical protein